MADGKDSLINGDGINYGSPGAVAVGKNSQQYALGGNAQGDGDKETVDATKGYPSGVTINPLTGYNSGNQTAGFGGSAIGVTYGDKPDVNFFDKFKEIAARVFSGYEKPGIEKPAPAQPTGATVPPGQPTGPQYINEVIRLANNPAAGLDIATILTHWGAGKTPAEIEQIMTGQQPAAP